MQVGNYIQYKGGVVTAEELAPYLDVPAAGKDADSIVVDESYIVPALVRFGGSPDVDKNNNLVYKFPSLQKTGRQQVGSALAANMGVGSLQLFSGWCSLVLAQLYDTPAFQFRLAMTLSTCKICNSSQ